MNSSHAYQNPRSTMIVMVISPPGVASTLFIVLAERFATGAVVSMSCWLGQDFMLPY